LIGTITAPENWKKILVNLSSECPEDFQHSDASLKYSMVAKNKELAEIVIVVISSQVPLLQTHEIA